jgi:long-subunit fatty acid transport protein
MNLNRRKLFVAMLATVVLALWGAAPGSAHPLDMYGYGPRAVAMGGAYAAVADDYSALYYNIGGLTQIEDNSVTSGFMFSSPVFKLDLDPAPGVSARQAKELRQLANDRVDVDSVNGYFFGVAIKPHRLFAVGFGAYLPEGLIVRLEPFDASVPTFIRHEHRSQRVVTMVGGAIRVLPTLSIGGGVRLFLKAKGAFKLPVELNQENLELAQGEEASEPIDPDLSLKIDFPLTTYPFAGIHFQPTENLRFGVSYQYEYQLDVELDMDIELVVRDYTLDLSELDQIAPGLLPLKAVVELNIPELGQTPLRVPVELSGLEGEIKVNAKVPIDGAISMTDLWKPQSVTGGVAYDPIDALTLSFDAVWFDWSQYPSPDIKLEVDDITLNLQTLPASIKARVQSLSVPVLGTVGPLPPVSISLSGVDASITIPVKIAEVTPVKTHDIVVPHMGAEYRFQTIRSFYWTGDLDLALRGGYTYSPTPFDSDSGPSNLIDLDQHIVSAGGGAMFNQLFQLDFYAQYRYLPELTVNKRTVDPTLPFDSLTASGQIFGGGVSATVHW